MPVMAGISFACLIGLLAGQVNGVVVTFGRVPRSSSRSDVGGLSWRQLAVGRRQADQCRSGVASLARYDQCAPCRRAGGHPDRHRGMSLSAFLRRMPWAANSMLSDPIRTGHRSWDPSRGPVLGAFVVAGLWRVSMARCGLHAMPQSMPVSRSGFELTVIASVVVGGVAFVVARARSWYRPRRLHASSDPNGLTLVRVDPLWLHGVYGLIILLAVAIDATWSQRARMLGGGHDETSPLRSICDLGNFLASLRWRPSLCDVACRISPRVSISLRQSPACPNAP